VRDIEKRQLAEKDREERKTAKDAETAATERDRSAQVSSGNPVSSHLVRSQREEDLELPASRLSSYESLI
jgi:hypothetical protein